MQKSSRTIIFGTLVGRIFGYFRELSIIFLFGISKTADELIFVLTSFDALASVFAYGTITLIGTKYVIQNKTYFNSLRKYIFGLGFIYSLFCSLFIFLDSSKMGLELLIPFVALLNIEFSLQLSIQQVNSDYIWTAFTSVIINIILILCIFVFPNKLLFLLILILGILIRNTFIKYYNRQRYNAKEYNSQLSKKELKIIALTIFGSGIYYLMPVADRFVANYFDEISIFNYSDRILVLFVVITNSAFIYPKIIHNKDIKVNYFIKKIIRPKLIYFGFIISILPLLFLLIANFIDYQKHPFLDLVSYHFLHFLPAVFYISIIQLWTLESKYKEILKLALFLLICRFFIFYITNSIIQYTVILLLVDFLGIYLILSSEKK